MAIRKVAVGPAPGSNIFEDTVSNTVDEVARKFAKQMLDGAANDMDIPGLSSGEALTLFKQVLAAQGFTIVDVNVTLV